MGEYIMKSRKYSLVLLSIFLVLLIFIGSASAAKDNETDVVSIDKSTNMVNEKLALDSSLDNAVSNDNNAVENNGNVLKESTDASNILSEEKIIYVNSSAGDGGDGSQDNPFQTLDDALNEADDGDTIMIASGQYNGTKNTGLEIENNLTFIKYGDSEAIFDAESQRRIFNVLAMHITINGLTFKNGKADEGVSDEGGAIRLEYVGNIFNCNFINNNAGGGGGAIYSMHYDTNVTNCTFFKNKAKNGGAFYSADGSKLENCTFISNNATGDEYCYGGAICIVKDDGRLPTVLNCIFINNNAKASGGAIYTCHSNITYCAFINNIAPSDYGIMIEDDDVVNLSNNWWGSNNPNWNALIGGNYTLSVYAVLNVIVEPVEIYPDGKSSIKTKFVWNGTNTDATSLLPVRDVLLSSNGTLTETEGDVGLTSQFSANASGIYYVNATVDNEILGVNVKVNKYASKIDASPVVTVYNVNQDLIVTLTDVNGKPLGNSNVTIDLNGAKTYTTDSNGQVKLSTAGLTPQVYTAKITFAGNDVYNGSSADVQVTVNKAKTQITADAIITTYNIDKDLVITLKDSNGNPVTNATVIVDLDGAKTYTTDTNGQVKVSTAGLVPKIYTAKITFAGDNNYNESSIDVGVTVNKANPILKAKNKAYKAKKKVKKFSIILNDNIAKPIVKAKVTLKIGKKAFSAKTNSKGKATFKITKLTKKGKYKATVAYKGNNCYNKASKKVKLTIK